jgi:hypothetical protein
MEEAGMSANIGVLEAQRIMRERQSDADRLARQDREDRILREEPPLFFDAMATYLGETAKSFNLTMGLSGDDAMTFLHTSGQIELGKRHRPFLRKKIVLDQFAGKVTIRTDTTSRMYRPAGKDETWNFDIVSGELALNRQNLIECAEALFAGVADAFR